MKMNTIIKQFAGCLLSCLILMGMASCEGNEMFDKEQYKKVVYVLSNDDLTYPMNHSFNTPTSMGYISIYAGGTKPVDHDITVTLERDPEVLTKYNISNYDLDETKYAKELDPSRYTITSYKAVLKVGTQDAYVNFPIEVRPEGLSPDTTYLIPLRIVNDGTFELNLDKSQVLYRVMLANDFTSKTKPTVLFMRGTRISEGETGKPKQMSANKTLYPLTKRAVRLNAGLENSAGKVTEDLINKSSLIMEIKEETATTVGGYTYNPVVLRPYKTDLIQVEMTATTDDEGNQLSMQESNRFVTEDEDVVRYYLSYKYRTLKTAATEDAEAEWNLWTYIYENMKVSE